jgi:hypothetical protein
MKKLVIVLLLLAGCEDYSFKYRDCERRCAPLRVSTFQPAMGSSPTCLCASPQEGFITESNVPLVDAGVSR